MVYCACRVASICYLVVLMDWDGYEHKYQYELGGTYNINILLLPSINRKRDCQEPRGIGYNGRDAVSKLFYSARSYEVTWLYLMILGEMDL